MSTQLTPIARQKQDADVSEGSGVPARYARFGDFHVDLQTEELFQNGRRVKMQGKLYRALLLLLSRAGEIISREEVRKWLWPDVFLTNLDANVNTTMNKLRLVLGDSPEKPQYIETMPRRGYTFIAAVEYSEQPHTSPVTDAVSSERKTPVPAGTVLAAAHRFHSALRVAGLLFAGMLVGALLMFVWFFSQAKNHRTIESGKAIAALALPHTDKTPS